MEHSTKKSPTEHSKLMPPIAVVNPYTERTKALASWKILDQEILDTCLSELIHLQKQLTNAGVVDVFFSCCSALEEGQDRELNKDDYQVILEALHKKVGHKLDQALNAAGFKAVDSWSYHSNSKAQEKIEALSSWLEKTRPDPLNRMSVYMRALDLGHVLDFFSTITDPTIIGDATVKLNQYQKTAVGKSPEYILSDADGSIGAVILAGVRAGHLHLPATAYAVLARVLVRERYGYLRVLDKINHREEDGSLKRALEDIDQKQYKDLAKITTTPYYLTYRADLSKCKYDGDYVFATLQADQTHSEDLMELVRLIMPINSASAVPLRLIGDLLHDRFTCNDDAMILLMSKLPNVIKYMGNHDVPQGKELTRRADDTGGHRAQPNLDGLAKLANTFTFFTWEEKTLTSHFGLYCKVTKAPSDVDENYHLQFILGASSVVVGFTKDEMGIDGNGNPFFFDDEKGKNQRICRDRVREVVNKLIPGQHKGINDTLEYIDWEDGGGVKPNSFQLHQCNELLGIRQICGHFEGFGLNEYGDVLRINSRALKDESIENPLNRLAPGMVLVAHTDGEWMAKPNNNQAGLLEIPMKTAPKVFIDQSIPTEYEYL